MQAVKMAENVEQYFLETSSFPPDIATLATTTGFQHVKGYLNTWQGYATSPTINDGVWQFQRAVLYSSDPTTGQTQADYLNANACGSDAFDVATSWCGAKKSQWFRRETRDRFNEQITTQRVRMWKLLQKVADYYNESGAFPNKDNVGVALAANSMTSIQTLVGYSGTAASCTGTFSYMGVPVDCGDMFDLWGNPIGYQYVSSTRVVLVSEPPIFNTSGNRVVVAVEYDLSLM